MKTVLTIFVASVIVILAGVSFAYSGLLDVSASSPHSAITSWYMSTTARASIKRHAVDVVVPDVADDQLVLAGINDYESMCIGCHGAPGQRPGPIGQGLNPRAPDLAKSAHRMSAAEMFWVTKHGIRMTGMPAWGVTHDDDAIWPVVAFMARLPDLDAPGYKQLLANATGHGHHATVPSSPDQEGSEEAKAVKDHSHIHGDDSADKDESSPEGDQTHEHEHGTHEH